MNTPLPLKRAASPVRALFLPRARGSARGWALHIRQRNPTAVVTLHRECVTVIEAAANRPRQTRFTAWFRGNQIDTHRRASGRVRGGDARERCATRRNRLGVVSCRHRMRSRRIQRAISAQDSRRGAAVLFTSGSGAMMNLLRSEMRAARCGPPGSDPLRYACGTRLRPDSQFSGNCVGGMCAGPVLSTEPDRMRF